MTKTESAIKAALQKGYHINDNGILIGLRGKPLPIKLRGSQKYPTFPINLEGRVYGIPVHQFAAYTFYGAKPKGQVVRHLDGNTCNNSKSNIMYGTHSENNLDKPKHIRIAAAKKANAAQERHPSLKLSDEVVKLIYDEWVESGYHFKNGRASELAILHGVNRNTITANVKRYQSSKLTEE